ncbi:MAG: DNA polymerase/3'-5' exonuclease PolX [Chitinispirillaceae bacterium]
MRVHNTAIAETFNDLADLLEIKGENPFRIRAYRNAARTVSALPQDIGELLEQGEDLSTLPGIGKDLAGKIKEIATTGHLSVLDKLEETLSPELIELMRIAGLGGKRVMALYTKLGVHTLEGLEKAAAEHRICKIPGFGEKIEQSILEGIKKRREQGGRFGVLEAEETASLMVSYLKNSGLFREVVVAGSFRRKKDTVRDLDVLAAGAEPAKAAEVFCSYPAVTKVVSSGGTRSTVILVNRMQVDLRVVPVESYGAALHYFTGSQLHNIAVRKKGVKLGLKINEYGVYKGKKRLGGKEESDVFRAVGLPYIPPELREDAGEIEAAQKGRLPDLIEADDIRGDLHAHTNYTDGKVPLEEMVEAAKAMGYEYVAITDHSQRLAMTGGLDEVALRGQISRIDRLNQKLRGFTVLKGIEVDILENGELDLPDSVLRELDLCVCSIHSRFNLSFQKQTDRILRAMDNPHFTIFGHPTGRIVNRRMPYEYDFEKVVRRAAQRGCFLEINSSPDRLDIHDHLVRTAASAGVKIAVNTDAHNTGDLKFIRFGVGQARRGWLSSEDVVNTRSLKKLRELLEKSRV